MTRTNKEIIQQINRLSGNDRTEELKNLPKYKLMLILEDIHRDEEQEELRDFSSRMGLKNK
jgi:hypothetical protein